MIYTQEVKTFTIYKKKIDWNKLTENRKVLVSCKCDAYKEETREDTFFYQNYGVEYNLKTKMCLQGQTLSLRPFRWPPQ